MLQTTDRQEQRWEQRGEKGGREEDNLDEMESDGVHGNGIVTFIPTLNTQRSRARDQEVASLASDFAAVSPQHLHSKLPPSLSPCMPLPAPPIL